ncbi:hypothetical protein [Dactylosporangium sp. NPDC005555]|uniref:hypothetical protein n=1 Tax=Dactylosporangium sp. NPDC005555 TaxID=3154889 RepID=UPI0033AAF2E6
MGRWGARPARVGLAVLLLAAFLLTPLARAQSAHLALGHPDSPSAAAGHDHHGAAGEHSHQHHHNVLHTAGAPTQPQQPKLPAGSETVTVVPAGVVAEPAPRTTQGRDTGRPRQSHLQVLRI